jgi:hypothetical protein
VGRRGSGRAGAWAGMGAQAWSFPDALAYRAGSAQVWRVAALLSACCWLEDGPQPEPWARLEPAESRALAAAPPECLVRPGERLAAGGSEDGVGEARAVEA